MAPSVKVLDLSNTAGAYFAPGTISPAEGRLLHVSGQIGATKSGHVPSDYESQINLALLNVRKIIVTAGSRVQHIAKLTIYIVGYDAKNRKHPRPLQRFFKGTRPAMTLVPVTQLAAPEWLVEIDATVWCPPTIEQVPRGLTASKTGEKDVVIIGAGLAGLAAARAATRAGLSCVILEGRDRVGGRTWSRPLPGGGVVEVGAGWINDVNQTRMIALAREFGLETIEQNTNGMCAVQDLDGTVSTFPYGELPRFDKVSVANMAEIRDMCEADCQALDIFQPRDTKLDALTFEAYLRSRNASEKAIWSATIWTRAMLGVDPRDVSALFFLNYCKSGGGLLNMRSDRKGGGQHLRLRQGTQAVSTGLAATLPTGVLQLNTPVASINHGSTGPVEVISSTDSVYRGRKVIVTVPSPVLKTIQFTPSLHPAKLAWSDSASYGYYSKAMMVFKSAFWIPKGFCGLAHSFTGPAAVIRDSCSPADNKAVLTCFMGGPPAQEWAQLEPAVRLEKLLYQLGQLFQAETQVKEEFVDMVIYEWNGDEFAGYGCPCASLPPGVLDTLGPDALRQSVGSLHFAGTETSGEWKGYMEGAVRSGERAADEVIRDLERGFLSARL